MKRTRSRLDSLAALIALLGFPIMARAEVNLSVRSNGDCPSVQAVQEALSSIRTVDDWPALSATVDVVADGAEVALGDSPGHRRTIPLPDDCAERANRVALVIAVWAGALPSDAPTSPMPAVPAPIPEPRLVLSSATPSAPAAKTSVFTEVGISGFYATVGGWVPGARVEVGRLPRAGHWGLRASVAHHTPRSLRVDIGNSQYDRTSVSGALVLQWNGPRVFVSSDWGVIGAFTRAHGDGYSENAASSGQNVGIQIDGRAGVRVSKVRIWAALGLCRWALKENIRVDRVSVGPSNGPPTSYSLPSWDAQLGLGTSLLFD
jgi:hypothetical protein